MTLLFCITWFVSENQEAIKMLSEKIEGNISSKESEVCYTLSNLVN